VTLTQQRDLDHDAAFGIEQLTTIGWTSTSTSKSNPHPAQLVCRNLRDLIATWYPRSGDSDLDRAGTDSPIVYRDDVPEKLLLALESLTVVSSESMQHQTLAAVYRTLGMAVRRMPMNCDQDVHRIALRSLSSLRDHVLTADLQSGIADLIGAMREAGLETGAIETARDQLAESVGHLNARSTRAQAAKQG
jgi:hypothetical protein